MEAGYDKQSFFIRDKSPTYYHPGKSGSVYLDKDDIDPVAYFGELHPNIVKKLDIKTEGVVGFEIYLDYLKDNMKYSSKNLVQREHSFAIVDEIDSCLIDEARTPLVISGQSDETSNQYKAINKLVTKLKPSDYELDEKDKNVTLTNKGIDSIEKLLKSSLYHLILSFSLWP